MSPGLGRRGRKTHCAAKLAVDTGAELLVSELTGCALVSSVEHLYGGSFDGASWEH